MSTTSGTDTTFEGEDDAYEGEGYEGEGRFEGAYYGERNEKGQMHGMGIEIHANCDYYEGYYRRGLRHGKGKYVFPSGARYIGYYYKDQRQGLGTFVYPDGTIYTGEWKKGLRHGYGAYMYASGDVYEGQWRDDHRHGLGKYKFFKDKAYYFGHFQNGVIDGLGQLVYDRWRVHGKFFGVGPIGKGVFTFPDTEYMVLGYWVQVRNPMYDMIEHEKLKYGLEGYDDDDGMEEGDEEPENPIVSIYRIQDTVPFSPELVPGPPKPFVYPPSPPLSPFDSETEEAEADAYRGNIFDEIAKYDGLDYDEVRACRCSMDSWDYSTMNLNEEEAEKLIIEGFPSIADIKSKSDVK